MPGAVAEVPGVRERIPVGIRSTASVEAVLGQARHADTIWRNAQRGCWRDSPQNSPELASARQARPRRGSSPVPIPALPAGLDNRDSAWQSRPHLQMPFLPSVALNARPFYPGNMGE